MHRMSLWHALLTNPRYPPTIQLWLSYHNINCYVPVHITFRHYRPVLTSSKQVSELWVEFNDQFNTTADFRDEPFEANDCTSTNELNEFAKTFKKLNENSPTTTWVAYTVLTEWKTWIHVWGGKKTNNFKCQQEAMSHSACMSRNNCDFTVSNNSHNMCITHQSTESLLHSLFDADAQN